MDINPWTSTYNFAAVDYKVINGLWYRMHTLSVFMESSRSYMGTHIKLYNELHNTYPTRTRYASYSIKLCVFVSTHLSHGTPPQMGTKRNMMGESPQKLVLFLLFLRFISKTLIKELPLEKTNLEGQKDHFPELISDKNNWFPVHGFLWTLVVVTAYYYISLWHQKNVNLLQI